MSRAFWLAPKATGKPWKSYGCGMIVAFLLLIGQVLIPPSAAASYGTPSIPPALEVPAGYTLRFASHAIGVQIYACQSGQWVFHAPRALLFDKAHRKLTAFHYGGIDYGQTPGPWWQSVRDSSRIRGGNAVSAPSPNPNSIPILRLEVLEHHGSGIFDNIGYIQRLNTRGGVGPTGACTDGSKRAVPYTADYLFYGKS